MPENEKEKMLEIEHRCHVIYIALEVAMKVNWFKDEDKKIIEDVKQQYVKKAAKTKMEREEKYGKDC